MVDHNTMYTSTAFDSSDGSPYTRFYPKQAKRQPKKLWKFKPLLIWDGPLRKTCTLTSITNYCRIKLLIPDTQMFGNDFKLEWTTRILGKWTCACRPTFSDMHTDHSNSYVMMGHTNTRQLRKYRRKCAPAFTVTFSDTHAGFNGCKFVLKRPTP